MRPAEFWRSTPADLYYMAKGARRRDRHLWEKLGWHAANTMNPHLQRPVTMQGLLSFLGDEDGKVPEQKTPEEAAAFVEEIAREHKKKFWTLIDDKFAPQEDKEK